MARDGSILVLNGLDVGEELRFQFEAQGPSADNSAKLLSTALPNVDDPLCFWVGGEQKKFRARLEFHRGLGGDATAEPDLIDVLKKLNRWKSRDIILRTAPTVLFSHGFHQMMVGLIKSANPSNMPLDGDNLIGHLTVDIEIWKTPTPPYGGGVADPIF